VDQNDASGSRTAAAGRPLRIAGESDRRRRSGTEPSGKQGVRRRPRAGRGVHADRRLAL